jgi:HAD domain in Swiss Army Knife RNA repair proteins
MKVIFLDIDGVLNCDATPNPRKFPYVIDKKLLARLKRLLERTGAKVVLTSSWRVDPIGRLAARHWGLPVFDCAPDLPKKTRRDEVLSWLADHPKVTCFAIVDDEDDELDELPLFQPSQKTGLTGGIVRGIERYLNGATDKTMRASLLVRAGQNLHSLFRRDKS